jgi:hypothetical protein
VQPQSSEAARAANSAELHTRTVAHLKDLCAQCGLCKAGPEAALVARLCDALCADAPAAKRRRTAS